MPNHKPHPEAVRIAVAEPFKPRSTRWAYGPANVSLELTQHVHCASRYAPQSVNSAIKHALLRAAPGSTVTVFNAGCAL